MERKKLRASILNLAKVGCYLACAFLWYTSCFAIYFSYFGPASRHNVYSLWTWAGPRLLEGALFAVIGMAFGMIVEITKEMELIA